MRKKPSVTERAQRPDSMYGYCRVVGCPNPTRAGSSQGLDRRFCRKHADFYSRHGSPYKGSYSAAELQPHRKIVRAWLSENRENPWVINATTRVQGLYERAGEHVEAFRLTGMKPKDRAKKVWARMRATKVPALRIVEAWLVIDRAIATDPQPVQTKEFQRVQAAKLIHRLASGSHKRWTREIPRMVGVINVPIVEVTELHKYPQSRGRVLRLIGADMEEACAFVTEAARKELQY